MKKLVVATLIVFVVLVAGVTAIGYALPQGHVASREGTFEAAPSEVFDTIVDVARYPDWRTDISRIDVLSDAPRTWREHSGGDAITFATVDSRRAELLQVRIADPELPFGGTWTYELAPAGAGTRLTITERGEVYNPIFRFVSRFVIGHTATLDTYLADLHRRLAR